MDSLDSLITAAARALSAGDPLGALKRVALRDDAPALALRGIAMAQLGDFARAKELLRNAARAFGPKEPVARARCIVAEAEIAFASRDLGWPARMLDAARLTLEAHGDRLNAGFARYLEVRRLLLIGHLDEAVADGIVCVAPIVVALLVLWSAVLAFPAPWKMKALGLAAGSLIIQVLNIIRFVSLFYIGQYSMTWFDFAHEYLWESLLVLDTMVVFWLWVNRVSRYTAARHATT